MKTGKLAPGMTAVSAHLIVKDIQAAMEFYHKAFGFEKRMAMPGPDGKMMHGEMTQGDCTIMLGAEMPQMGYKAPGGESTSMSLYVYVEDVDKLFAQAMAAGCKTVKPVQDQFYGDRTGTLSDPFGYHWTFGTHQRVVSEAEMKEAMKQMAGA